MNTFTFLTYFSDLVEKSLYFKGVFHQKYLKIKTEGKKYLENVDIYDMSTTDR